MAFQVTAESESTIQEGLTQVFFQSLGFDPVVSLRSAFSAIPQENCQIAFNQIRSFQENLKTNYWGSLQSYVPATVASVTNMFNSAFGGDFFSITNYQMQGDQIIYTVSLGGVTIRWTPLPGFGNVIFVPIVLGQPYQLYFTCNFDSNGGTPTPSTQTYTNIEPGTGVLDRLQPVTNPAQSGYAFTGWYYNGELVSQNGSTFSGTLTMPMGDLTITLTAEFGANGKGGYVVNNKQTNQGNVLITTYEKTGNPFVVGETVSKIVINTETISQVLSTVAPTLVPSAGDMYNIYTSQNNSLTIVGSGEGGAVLLYNKENTQLPIAYYAPQEGFNFVINPYPIYVNDVITEIGTQNNLLLSAISNGEFVSSNIAISETSLAGNYTGKIVSLDYTSNNILTINETEKQVITQIDNLPVVNNNSILVEFDMENAMQANRIAIYQTGVANVFTVTSGAGKGILCCELPNSLQTFASIYQISVTQLNSSFVGIIVIYDDNTQDIYETTAGTLLDNQTITIPSGKTCRHVQIYAVA